MESKIYWSGIEYEYNENSVEYKKLKGGFVYAFIKSNDVREALEIILSELNKNHLLPSTIEFVSPYEKEMEWETSKETSHYTKLYKTALKSSVVVFDDFYAYEKE